MPKLARDIMKAMPDTTNSHCSTNSVTKPWLCSLRCEPPECSHMTPTTQLMRMVSRTTHRSRLAGAPLADPPAFSDVISLPTPSAGSSSSSLRCGISSTATKAHR